MAAELVPGFAPPVVVPSEPKVEPPQVALYVPHQRSGKMCGRVVALPGQWIIYHESNGTQHHRKMQCIGGVDASLLLWMERHGVAEFHHEITRKVIDPVGLYVASRELIRSRGERRTWDNRARYFLPTIHWTFYPARFYDVPVRLPALELPETPV